MARFRSVGMISLVLALAACGKGDKDANLASLDAQLTDNATDPALKGACREAVEILVHLIAPVMPHLAEECWETLGGTDLVAERPWPIFDPALVVDNEVTYPVQVNGKKRGDLTIARDADQGAVEKAVLALDFVQKALEGKAPRKVIIVPQRIVNVVA